MKIKSQEMKDRKFRVKGSGGLALELYLIFENVVILDRINYHLCSQE